jgi:Fe-S cluster biogenesis protein NfuA
MQKMFDNVENCLPREQGRSPNRSTKGYARANFFGACDKTSLMRLTTIKGILKKLAKHVKASSPRLKIVCMVATRTKQWRPYHPQRQKTLIF